MPAGAFEAGDFDRRIVVERATFTKDAAGDPIPTWTPDFRRWAIRKAGPMTQSDGAGSVLREMVATWILRDDSESREIAPESHRITYDGRVYVINGIAESEDGRHAYRVISTSTRPDNSGTQGQAGG